MGIRNLRAICPNCGGKINTQPKGLGHFTWANSWMLVETGKECQHCGVALSGKVAAGNKAILAEDAEKTWFERESGIDPTADRAFAVQADDLLEGLVRAMEANSRSGWQPGWKRQPFKNLKVDRSRRVVTANSDLRHWEMTVTVNSQPTGGDGSHLRISSKRVAGAFIEWGERKRLEKRVMKALAEQLASVEALGQ